MTVFEASFQRKWLRIQKGRAGLNGQILTFGMLIKMQLNGIAAAGVQYLSAAGKRLALGLRSKLLWLRKTEGS